MVRDQRTRFETPNIDSVLGGDLDPFMESWLRWSRAAGAAGRVEGAGTVATSPKAAGGDA